MKSIIQNPPVTLTGTAYVVLRRRRSTVFLSLQFEHFRILTVLRHQLIVTAGFDQFAVREHENPVRHTCG